MTIKLLQEILNPNISEYTIINNILYYYTKKGGIARSNIGINDLISILKDWSFDQGYSVSSGRRFENFTNKKEYFCEYNTWKGLNDPCSECGEPQDDFKVGKTEIEAVSKVCEWILEKKDTK